MENYIPLKSSKKCFFNLVYMRFAMNENNRLVFNHDYGQLVSDEYPKISIQKSTSYKLENITMNIMQHEDVVMFCLDYNEDGDIIINIPTLKTIVIENPFTIHFSYKTIKVILKMYEISYNLREDDDGNKYYKLTSIEMN